MTGIMRFGRRLIERRVAIGMRAAPGRGGDGPRPDRRCPRHRSRRAVRPSRSTGTPRRFPRRRPDRSHRRPPPPAPRPGRRAAVPGAGPDPVAPDPGRAVRLHGLDQPHRPQLRAAQSQRCLRRLRQLPPADARPDLLAQLPSDPLVRVRGRRARVPARLRARAPFPPSAPGPGHRADAVPDPDDAGAGRDRADLEALAAGRLRHADPLSARGRHHQPAHRPALRSRPRAADHHADRRLAMDPVRDPGAARGPAQPAPRALRGRGHGRRPPLADLPRRHPADAPADHRTRGPVARDRRLQGVRQGLHPDRRRPRHRDRAALDLHLPDQLQGLGPRLWRGLRLHGLSGGPDHVLGVLQGDHLDRGPRAATGGPESVLWSVS